MEDFVINLSNVAEPVPGEYVCVVRDVAHRTSKSGNDTVRLMLSVVEPQEYEGATFFDDIVVGGSNVKPAALMRSRRSLEAVLGRQLTGPLAMSELLGHWVHVRIDTREYNGELRLDVVGYRPYGA